MPELMEAILRAIHTDTDYDEREEDLLIKTYEESDQSAKDRIDSVFVCLTGYRLSRLILDSREVSND